MERKVDGNWHLYKILALDKSPCLQAFQHNPLYFITLRTSQWHGLSPTHLITKKRKLKLKAVKWLSPRSQRFLVVLAFSQPKKWSLFHLPIFTFIQPDYHVLSNFPSKDPVPHHCNYVGHYVMVTTTISYDCIGPTSSTSRWHYWDSLLPASSWRRCREQRAEARERSRAHCPVSSTHWPVSSQQTSRVHPSKIILLWCPSPKRPMVPTECSHLDNMQNQRR